MPADATDRPGWRRVGRRLRRAGRVVVDIVDVLELLGMLWRVLTLPFRLVARVLDLF